MLINSLFGRSVQRCPHSCPRFVLFAYYMTSLRGRETGLGPSCYAILLNPILPIRMHCADRQPGFGRSANPPVRDMALSIEERTHRCATKPLKPSLEPPLHARAALAPPPSSTVATCSAPHAPPSPIHNSGPRSPPKTLWQGGGTPQTPTPTSSTSKSIFLNFSRVGSFLQSKFWTGCPLYPR